VPSLAVLTEGDRKNPLIKIDAIPRKTVLLTEPESTVQCEIQFWNVMRTFLGDCRPKPDLFLWLQIANPTIVLPSQFDQTRWIVFDFAILDGQSKCERQQCAIYVASGWLLAKRSATQQQHQQAIHNWKASDIPAWLTRDVYVKRVQPVLAGVAKSRICSALW
jgi:hypothetical protein